MDRKAELHPAIGQIPPRAGAQAVFLTAPCKETPLLLGHPTLALDQSRTSLPHLFKPFFLPAYDRTSSSEPLCFPGMKSVFQSVDLQVQSGQHTKAAPKYTNLPSEGFPACIPGKHMREHPVPLLPCAFETPIQLVSHKSLGRINPAPQHPTHTRQHEQSTLLCHSQAPSAPRETQQARQPNPNSNSSVSSLCGQAELSAVPAVLLNSLYINFLPLCDTAKTARGYARHREGGLSLTCTLDGLLAAKRQAGQARSTNGRRQSAK